jgi:hypothetical protein
MPPDKCAGKPAFSAAPPEPIPTELINDLAIFTAAVCASPGSRAAEDKMGFAAEQPGAREPLRIHLAPPTAPEANAAEALARMIEQISHVSPRSGAEALRELRAAFPDSPLTLRVAALGMLLRQQGDRAS